MNDIALNPDSKILSELGKSDLQERWAATEIAIAKMDGLQDIWNRSRSDWALSHLTLSYHAPWKNLRQIAAEVSAKQQALSEAKFTLMRLKLEIKQAESRSFERNDEIGRQFAAIDIAQKKEQIGFILRKFEGAINEIDQLSTLYDQAVAQIGAISKQDFEAAEAESHLKRALVQAIRDVRSYGSITKGEQEYLEQCGANPSRVLADIRVFVEGEAKGSYGVGKLWDFVDHMVKNISPALRELNHAKHGLKLVAAE